MNRIGEPLTEEEINNAVEHIRQLAEEDFRRAPKCLCGDRCDPPYGNGEQCLVCFSRPTAEDMRIIVY